MSNAHDEAETHETQDSIFDKALDYEVLLRLNHTKRIDMKISIDITGIGNSIVRDNNGNLLPYVWTRQSIYNEFENATLLTREALQKHLQSFLDLGIKENEEMLQKVKDPAVLVDWVVRTAEYWEKRYAEKRNEKYDISQTILSVMSEVIFDTVWPALNEQNCCDIVVKTLHDQTENINSSKNKYHNNIVRHVSTGSSNTERDLESFFWFHKGHNALVRLLYRMNSNHELREHLCLLAGKLLQKKEVCNKAGTYASHRQRSDVIQEWFYAKRDFDIWCENNASKVRKQLLHALKQDEWIFLVIDHTAVPVSLSVSKTPVVNNVSLHTQNTNTVCPHCQMPWNLQPPQKRQREAQREGESFLNF